MLNKCQINNFQITKQIGSGAFGLVFHAVDLISENEYAIKAILKNPQQSSRVSSIEKVKKSTLLQNQLYHLFKSYRYKLFLPSINLDSIKNLNDNDLLMAANGNATQKHPQFPECSAATIENAAYYKEIALHLRVHNHQNIVTIHQVLESSLATFIVMDYYPTDLFTSIVDHQHFSHDPLLVKKVFLQLCSVLQHCHENNVYHCDIKPENILLDAQDNVYLCDFGLSTIQPYLPSNACIGSSYYMPPERSSCEKFFNCIAKQQQQQQQPLLERQFPTAFGDVWSIGIILINLACIRNPWLKADCANDNTFQYFSKDPSILKKILPVSEELFQILSRVLKLNPWERISLNDLIMEVAMLKSFTSDPKSPLHCAPVLSQEQIELFTSYNSQELFLKRLLESYNENNSYDQMRSDSDQFGEESRANSNVFDTVFSATHSTHSTNTNYNNQYQHNYNNQYQHNYNQQQDLAQSQKHRVENIVDFSGLSATSTDTAPSDSMEMLFDFNLNNNINTTKTNTSSYSSLKIKNLVLNNLHNINAEADAACASLNSFLQKLDPLTATTTAAKEHKPVDQFQDFNFYQGNMENQPYVPNYESRFY